MLIAGVTWQERLVALEGCSLSMELEGGEDITMHGQAHRRRTAPNAEFTQQERVFRGSWVQIQGAKEMFSERSLSRLRKSNGMAEEANREAHSHVVRNGRHILKSHGNTYSGE